MSELIKIRNGSNVVTLMVAATELAELKLGCEVACEPELRTASGEKYSAELIRVLCIEGMRRARRKLSIEYGLQVIVSGVHGTLARCDEVAVSHATVLGIARALEKDDSSLHELLLGWVEG